MNSLEIKPLGQFIKVLTDYHANGSYENLSNNVTLLKEKDHALMVRTLNFERNDFESDLIFIDEIAYDFLEKSKVYENDILINKIANPGSVYIMPKVNMPVSCGMNLFLVRFNELVNQRYMFYCMKFYENYIKSFAHGTTTKTITKKDLKDIKLPIHTNICEQNKIEKVLTLLDKKIETNNKINKNLEAQLQLLYDYWFTQFDFPDENNQPYQSSGGKMVWSDELNREIPEGWGVESIIKNRLSTVIKPGVNEFKTKMYYATADINGRTIGTGNMVTFKNRETRANMQPTINSVWFAKMKNSIKHLFLNKNMSKFINSSILSTGFCGIKCKENSFEYISSFISSNYFESIKDILSHGATQQAVNSTDMLGIKLIIPEEKILNKYHKLTKPMYAQLSLNICENIELAKLRNFLLPLLMNGQAKIVD